MADPKDKTKDTAQAPTEQEAAPKKNKKALFVGGGGAAVIALAYTVSMMAVPHKAQHKSHLQGPFVARLSKNEIQVNLAGESSKRYLVMALNAEYFAYDEGYVVGRLGSGSGGAHGDAPTEDPLYTAMLKDALLRLAATKTRDQVTDPMLIDAFMADVRTVVEPVLFPVYVGDSHAPSQPDSVSGLRSGESIMDSTHRGLLHEHALSVDAKKQTIAFDGGPVVGFEGGERDLLLKNKAGKTVYVDVTAVRPDFVGDVPIGVPGKLRRIYRDSFLVQ
jgi:hypothetical protein